MMGYVLRACFIPVSANHDLVEITAYYAEEFGENIQYDPNAAFAAVGAESESDFEPYDLARDSARFGEALGIQFTTYGDDFLLYDHWCNGVCVRALTFSPTEGWVRVAGAAEEWERAAFFPAGRLEQDLAGLECDSHRSDKAQRIAQLHHLLEVQHLTQGDRYPVITGEGTWFELMKHFKLTWPQI